MCRIIDELTHKKGISAEAADFAFTLITDHLVSKIPALQQVVEDIRKDADDTLLNQHINNMVILLQQQQKEALNKGLLFHSIVIRAYGSDMIL